MFLPTLLDIGVISASQPYLIDDNRKKFIEGLVNYGEIQEKAKFNKFIW